MLAELYAVAEPQLASSLHLYRLDAAGLLLRGEGVGAAVGGEGGDAGCAEIFADAGVGECELDAVAVAGVDEEADGVVAGIAGEQRDQRIEAGAVGVVALGFVHEEAEDALRRAAGRRGGGWRRGTFRGGGRS